ncbi:MAG: hypothetical protein WDZ83_09280 [Rhizobiaceae bacterium]
MNRNQLYAVIAALVIVVVGFGVYIWREESKPEGVEIRLNEDGISIERD